MPEIQPGEDPSVPDQRERHDESLRRVIEHMKKRVRQRYTPQLEAQGIDLDDPSKFSTVASLEELVADLEAQT